MIGLTRKQPDPQIIRSKSYLRYDRSQFRQSSAAGSFIRLPMNKDVTMPIRPDRYCPIARTLDIVGDRWTMLILRDLVLDGPRKFQDLEQSLSGISPNTLSARLKTLEESGIVERRFYTDHPPRAEYLITGKGLELRPILRTLKTWGERHTRP
jgi:DNA-binding HxlR family transcriptional regulator